MKIVALIPAHNEEDNIVNAIKSVQDQLVETDIIVVADNCTDSTEQIAEQNNTIVFKTLNNKNKKAGALNQALDVVLPDLKDEDCILVLDADSYLDKSFLSHAISRLNNNIYSTSKYGGVGGTFRGRDGGGYVGFLQRNEFARYGRDTRRVKGKVLCLTGTATLFKVSALKKLSSVRSDGAVYNINALTEDFEITLALESLGYKVVSPKECTLTTEVMETWEDLGKQRLRWKRGAIESLIEYGITKITFKHWIRQIFTLLGIFVSFVYILSLILSFVAFDSIHIYPIWILITFIFMLERVVTVKERGLKASFLSFFLIFELPYDIYLQIVHIKAYWKALLKKEGIW